MVLICADSFSRNYNVPQSVSLVTIDGTLHDVEWDDAVIVKVEYPDIVTFPKEGTIVSGTEPPNPNDYSCLIFMKWDSVYFYIGFKVNDDMYDATVRHDEPRVCFNLLNNPDAAFLTEAIVWNIAVDGTIYSNGGLNATQSIAAGHIVNSGYEIETAIAWSDFASIKNYRPVRNDVHGIGFELQDFENSKREHFLVDFGQGVLNDSNVTTWNTTTLILQSDLSLGDWGYLSADINKDGRVDLQDMAIFANEWLKYFAPKD